MTVVGVCPPPALRARARLFGALAVAYGTAFVPREPGAWRDLDAVVIFGPVEGGPSSPGLPALSVPASEGRAAAGRVRLHDHDDLDRRLRGADAIDRRAGGCAPLPAACQGSVLASRAGAALWVGAPGGAPAFSAAVGPEELGAAERLSDHLREGRFLSLLPLVELIRRASAATAWRPPQPRAAIIIDDPNLRRPSYGYLSYEALVPHARRHRYHLAIAMLPIDARWAHPRAQRAFRGAPDVLSVLVHGNDHLRGELTRLNGEREAAALVGQALARVVAFERRTGVPVARVMAPPHEVWGDPLARAMLAAEMEAICADPDEAASRALLDGPLAGWGPADLAGGGLPVIPRVPLGTSLAELRLRAYLGQPIVLYGHHGDLRCGLEPLAGAAERLRAVDAFEWGSLERISRANVSTRVSGETLEVRMHARRAALRVPAGVRAVRAVMPPGHDAAGGDRVAWRVAGRSGMGDLAEAVPCPGPATLELRLRRVGAPTTRPPVPPRRLWPLVRRGLTEGRDRVAPALARRGRSRTRA